MHNPNVTLKTRSGQIIEDVACGPNLDQIQLEDIAHSLSQLCRFAGQSYNFYSVAAHSILVSEWIERNGGTPLEALCGLLHDASEAYLVDLPSPVKKLCPDYKRLEKRYMKKICTRFNLPFPMPEIVKEADQEILRQEKVCFDGINEMNWTNQFCDVAFIHRFNELSANPCIKYYFRYNRKKSKYAKQRKKI